MRFAQDYLLRYDPFLRLPRLWLDHPEKTFLPLLEMLEYYNDHDDLCRTVALETRTRAWATLIDVAPDGIPLAYKPSASLRDNVAALRDLRHWYDRVQPRLRLNPKEMRYELRD